MVINNRLAAVAASIGAAVVAVLVGCSTPSRPTSADTTPVAQSSSSAGQVVPASFTAPVPLRPGPHGSADGIDITIATEDSTTVRPGGPPMRFSVTLVNSTANDIEQVGLVVSLRHCSCGMPGPRMMP